MRIKDKVLLLTLISALLSSCSTGKPEPNVQWFRLINRNIEKTYNIDFTLRVSRAYKGSELPLRLEILSPEGKRYADTLRIPVKRNTHNHYINIISSGVWNDIIWHYRKNVAFPETGKWLFAVYYIETEKKEGMVEALEMRIK
ncbi:MAG: hypothetical protein VB022_04360 [Rikenellaceae bacterium]|nr:hypothetical protein [Rikenellaceae bacterium]